MTAEKILNKLKELGITGRHLHGYDIKKETEEYKKAVEEYKKTTDKYASPVRIAEFILGEEIYEIEQVGGEGEGDHYHVVFQFKKHDVYLRVDAFYDSWNGIDWDDDTLYEVRPKQKTITVYE